MNLYLPQFWEGISFLVYPTASYLLALVCLLVSFYWIKLIKRKLEKAIIIQQIEPSLRQFFISLISFGLKLCVFVSIASMLGIQTSSFVAIFGSLSVAISLALQGGLSNLAGGLSLLFFQPFKVGDGIELDGVSGDVEEISLYFTKIITDQKKIILIPNSLLANKIVTNESLQGAMRLDIKVNVAEITNLAEARNLLLATITNTKGVLEQPAPAVNILNLLDGDMQLICYIYCKPQEDNEVYFACAENIQKALQINRIDSPISHRVLIGSPLN